MSEHLQAVMAEHPQTPPEILTLAGGIIKGECTCGCPDCSGNWVHLLEDHVPDCSHRDGYGSTVIVGENPAMAPVCLLCDKRFPHWPLEVVA